MEGESLSRDCSAFEFVFLLGVSNVRVCHL